MNEPRSQAPPADVSAAATLRQLIMGFRITQLIYLAAKLGLADHLERADGHGRVVDVVEHENEVAAQLVLKRLADGGGEAAGPGELVLLGPRPASSRHRPRDVGGKGGHA